MNRESPSPTLSPETWPFEDELPNIASYDEILGHRVPREISEREEAGPASPDTLPTDTSAGVPSETSADNPSHGSEP